MPIEPLRPGEIVRARDERWSVSRVISHGAASIVELRGCGHTNRGARARFVLPFELLERVPVCRVTRVVRPGLWRHLAREALSAALPSPDALGAAARADISVLAFQLEPVLALTRGTASRLLIADEVGLGKTIQAGLAIAEIVERLDQPHVLVVVPAALREQWRGELETKFKLETTIADATSLARLQSSVVTAANPWLMCPVVITSIDYIKRPEAVRALEGLVWDLVVFDEAHSLSTRSDRNSAATALAERARSVVMLTATPHSGSDEDFARLCGLGDLLPRFPLLVFRRTRADVGLTGIRRTTWLSVRPTSPEARMHDALLRYAQLVWRQKGASSADARLAAIVLARRASSSAGSLAKSLDRRLALLSATTADSVQLRLPIDEAADDEPGAELGAAGLHDPDEERHALSILLALARGAQAHESKLQVLRRFLRRAGEPAIVFTEYRDTLARLQSELSDFDFTVLHGGLTAAERREALRGFTSGRSRLLLATDAASEGLNLHQHCRLVINLELPWTPRRLEQRVGRVERIGQSKRVHEVHLLAAGTFEETTLAALNRRAQRVREVVGALRVSTVREQDVARSVLGDDPLTTTPEQAPLPDGVFTIDLQEAAAREANRIVLARRLGTGLSPVGGRPFACAVRTTRYSSGAYWAFRIEFTDCDSRILWETVLAFEVGIDLPGIRAAADVRDLAERLRADLDPFLEREHENATATLTGILERPAALALSRERAIMTAARQRGARIAAHLAQGTLFDRRPNREAADQAAALDELLSRCHAHVERLTRQRHIVAGTREPVFALFRVRPFDTLRVAPSSVEGR